MELINRVRAWWAKRQEVNREFRLARDSIRCLSPEIQKMYVDFAIKKLDRKNAAT